MLTQETQAPRPSSLILNFTWLEGHLTEQQPQVAEVEAALDGAGCAIAEGDCNEAGDLA